MLAAVITFMLADTSDIHAFSAAHGRHAEDLTTCAAGLTAAHVARDAFGSVGAGFLASLNSALAREACVVAELAHRLTAAGATTRIAAESYRHADAAVGQALSARAV